MANELQTTQVTGLNLYAVLYSSTGQVWNTSTLGFEVFTSGHWSNYAITMAENNPTGVFVANLPSVSSGTYKAVVYLRAGGSPATSDVPLDTISINWNGSVVVGPQNVTVSSYASGEDPASLLLVTPTNKITTNASGNVTAELDMTQSVPTSNTSQTLGDALNAARADGFGKWVTTFDTSGNPTGATLYAGDGVTVVKTFTMTQTQTTATRG